MKFAFSIAIVGLNILYILPIGELNIINYVNVWQISAELINHIVPKTSVWLQKMFTDIIDFAYKRDTIFDCMKTLHQGLFLKL